jgi:hypothetical protein
MPRVLDWKYPDLHAALLDWAPLPPGVDAPEDVARVGYALVCVRDTPGGRYAVAVRGGWYWLARYARPDRFDGVRLTEVARTAVRYGGDDDETVIPAE